MWSGDKGMIPCIECPAPIFLMVLQDKEMQKMTVRSMPISVLYNSTWLSTSLVITVDSVIRRGLNLLLMAAFSLLLVH